MKFNTFNLTKNIQEAIINIGFTDPSPVQREAITPILNKHDIIAKAQTGTGKTAAFGLPIMSMIDVDNKLSALVIVPTRELAVQVSDELFRFGKFSKIKTATIYGGTPYNKQIERVKQAAIVVATPGRLKDLITSKRVKLTPQFVVLDEADKMLDMGFLDEIKHIFSLLPKNRQTLMFSATMPKSIRELAKQILNNPKTINIESKQSTNENITQLYYVVGEKEKDDALIRLIDYKNIKKCIVFCRTKREVDRLAMHLTAQGLKVSSLHGDIEQKQREKNINAFKRGVIDIFIATDVAARGLDINDVSHVFNYHIPFDSESYIHRIGRTGRGGKSGEAITLINPNEFSAIKRIEKDVGAKLITQVVPTITEVQNNRLDSLIENIIKTKITKEAINLVKDLEKDIDTETISYLLASILQQKNKVAGKDNIGLNLGEISLLSKKSFRKKDTSYKKKRNRHKFGSSNKYGNKKTNTRR